MYHVALEVFPRTASTDYGRNDTAVAAVFVDRALASEAEAAARALVERDGWNVEELLFLRVAHLHEIDHGLSDRAAFERALNEGIGVAYHITPLRGRPEDKGAA